MGAPKITALVAGVLVAATLSGVTPTSAGADASTSTPAASRPGDVVAAPTQAVRAVRETRRYWTLKRMAEAIPIEDVVPGLTDTTSYDDTLARASQGTAVRRREVPRTVGKLFFSDGGADYVCSAAAIKTRKANQVITAGHCVHTGPHVGLLQRPRFYSRWIFVPRFHRGRAPDGRWVASNAWAFNGWVENESFRYDQAIIAFKRRDGRKLVNVVGGNEVVWGKSQRHWGVRIWGWPAQDPYDGRTAQRCRGRTTRFENTQDAAMHHCPLNGGASGGPWYLPRGLTKNTGRIWAITSRRLLARPVLLARPIPSEIRRMIRTANR